jgi:hypothetical protein
MANSSRVLEATMTEAKILPDAAANQDTSDQRRRSQIQRILGMYAGLFLFMFAGIVAYGIFTYVSKQNVHDMTFYEGVMIVLGMLIALVSLVLGTRTMLKDASAPTVVIPAQDRRLLESLIRDSNEKGIDQYVRLSSLSGTTGTATKLGLTGLPLATVGLTIFFSIVAIFGVDGFLDLAKLTLGAFIGSFVQRNITGERMTSEGIRIINQGTQKE